MQMFGPNALTKNTLTAFTLGECLLVAIEISRDTLPLWHQLQLHLQLSLLLCCPKGRKMPASYSRAQLSLSLSLSPPKMAVVVAEKCFIALGTSASGSVLALLASPAAGDGLAGDCFAAPRCEALYGV